VILVAKVKRMKLLRNTLSAKLKDARDEMKSFDTAKTLGFCVQTTIVVCKPFGAAVGSEQKV